MGIFNDYILGGDYKGCQIKVPFASNKAFLIVRTFFGKKKIELSSKTVKSFKDISQLNDGFDSIGTTYNCEIVFQDGKKSFALLSSYTYQVIMARMYDKEQ